MDTGDLLDSEICGNIQCDMGYECAKGLNNPNWGSTSFDNILFAFLSVFQCVTLEGWTHIMVNVEKAFSEWVIFYFIPLVFIGAFFLLNITLAVVKSSFTSVTNEYMRRKSSSLSDYSYDSETESSLTEEGPV